jgi:hypothetical protein
MLSNNFSNYTITSNKKSDLILKSKKGFIFKNSDFNLIKVGEKPFFHGAYARSSFNGIVERRFTFSENQVFKTDVFDVTTSEVNQYGQARNLIFEFDGKGEEPNIFLLWESAARNYREINPEELIDRSLKIKNW